MRVLLPNRYSQWGAKDQIKATLASCFVGRGSGKSSTNKYRQICSGFLHSEYLSDDLVFVSVEGARQGRIPLDTLEVDKVIAPGASIICDNTVNRNRTYNVGERELFEYITQQNYCLHEETNDYAIFSPSLK